VRQFPISKRSISGYVNKPIVKEKILQLLDVARYTPNGANRQAIRWLVINNPAEVHPDSWVDNRLDEGRK
jgi:nitroreductase